MPLTFLITAGPTKERIDPVRYLTNDSSGKMGYALAREAKRLGHRVILVSGPTQIPLPKGVELFPVESAKEMHTQVMANYQRADVMICVAAVADYRPARVSKQKIKKNKQTLNLKLIKNPDILKDLGKKKKKNQILVGFAAETQNLIQNAKKKLKEKNCDWMVANNVAKKGIGFGVDQNEVVLLSKNGKTIHLKQTSKKQIAKKIIQNLV